MVGSTYSANSLLHGLYERAAGLDYGQVRLLVGGHRCGIGRRMCIGTFLYYSKDIKIKDFF